MPKPRSNSPAATAELALQAACFERRAEAVGVALEQWKALGDAGPAQSPLEFVVLKAGPWGVEELLKRGEPLTPIAVHLLLREIDQDLFSTISARKARAMGLLKSWALLLPIIEQSLVLRATAVEGVCREFQDGSTGRSRLPWAQLEMNRLVGADLDAVGVDGSEDFQLNDGAPLKMSVMQRCWSENRLDFCKELLDMGVSPSERYPNSCWPDWTLRQVLFLEPKDWNDWMATAEPGPALERALDLQRVHVDQSQTPEIESLRSYARAAELKEELPAARISIKTRF